MRTLIQKIVRETLLKEINAQIARESDKKMSPEEFSERVASIVAGSLPNFTEERKRDFDDPYDSFSTEKYVRHVSDWTEEWLWERKLDA